MAGLDTGNGSDAAARAGVQSAGTVPDAAKPTKLFRTASAIFCVPPSMGMRTKSLGVTIASMPKCLGLAEPRPSSAPMEGTAPRWSTGLAGTPPMYAAGRDIPTMGGTICGTWHVPALT